MKLVVPCLSRFFFCLLKLLALSMTRTTFVCILRWPYFFFQTDIRIVHIDDDDFEIFFVMIVTIVFFLIEYIHIRLVSFVRTK